ncbi:MAG: acetolactate synthase [Rhodobacterales bacterium 32-67-9]|nr:MAG: acetolactate synthase [Rhodobacterales bacterium 32-67-9]
MVADGIVPPSGQAISFIDTVQTAPGPEGLTVRFRFLAPGIARAGGSVDAEAAQADMLWLCDSYAVPRLPVNGPAPAQIVISLSDRAVPFGEAAPDVTQLFDAFRVEDKRCVWEPF